MKRSEINKTINEAIELFDSINFKLPPFAFWKPEEWVGKGDEIEEIRENMLGWNVSDLGKGDYDKYGLLDFTIRNGNYHKSEKYAKRYAEKIMMMKDGQQFAMHFHWKKCEDIINRGGGNLILELYKSTEDGRLSDEEFTVKVDGVAVQCKPGEKIRLTPGESICLEPFIYHNFYPEKGKGNVAVGEVSDVNDDTSDNRFYEKMNRFAEIEEDEPAVYPLSKDIQ